MKRGITVGVLVKRVKLPNGEWYEEKEDVHDDDLTDGYTPNEIMRDWIMDTIEYEWEVILDKEKEQENNK